MYALPARASKPYLSRADYGKGRADRAAGGEMGGKKGRSGKRGNTGVFSIVAAFIWIF